MSGRPAETWEVPLGSPPPLPVAAARSQRDRRETVLLVCAVLYSVRGNSLGFEELSVSMPGAGVALSF